MRWEDERYVRFYTRDTPEWLALSWQARGLFGLLMRVVDRAGILKLGKLGLKGVAVAVHAPWADVDAPLSELITDGCLIVNGEALLIPNYLAAQETPQSDAARKRNQRERDRLRVATRNDVTESHATGQDVTDRDNDTKRDDRGTRNVTEGHAASHEVTPGHGESHAVTPNRAVPSRALPIRALGGGGDPAGQRVTERDPQADDSALRAPPPTLDPGLTEQLETATGKAATDPDLVRFLHAAQRYPPLQVEAAVRAYLGRPELHRKPLASYLLAMVREHAGQGEPNGAVAQPSGHVNGPQPPPREKTVEEIENELVARGRAEREREEASGKDLQPTTEGQKGGQR